MWKEENIWRKAAAFMSHNDRASVAEVKAGNGLEISQNTPQRFGGQQGRMFKVHQRQSKTQSDTNMVIVYTWHNLNL